MRVIFGLCGHRYKQTHTVAWLTRSACLIQQFLDLDTSGSRVLRAIVFPRLKGIKCLEGEGILTAFPPTSGVIRDYCHKNRERDKDFSTYLEHPETSPPISRRRIMCNMGTTRPYTIKFTGKKEKKLPQKVGAVATSGVSPPS